MRFGLPAPGVVHGAYPENPSPSERPAWLAALIAAFDANPLVQRWQRAGLRRWVGEVRAMESAVPALDDPAFDAGLQTLRAECARDGLGSPAAAGVCAHVLAAMNGVLGKRLRDNQIMAARVMLDGALAEMPTGSGKTLSAALAACVAALAGVPVHVLSSNDYLARRDGEALRPLAERLGLRIGIVQQASRRAERRAAHACHIVYCAARELAFDYLRDRLLPAGQPEERTLRGLCMAIVDEADSVLIDEALTPFVLSESFEETRQLDICRLALDLAERLLPGEHFRIDARTRSIALSDAGRLACAACPGGDELFLWAVPRYREEMVTLALRAVHVLRRDEDYIVRDGRVHIVDATTGRVAEGRSWSYGLQQLVELREGARPSPATRSIAQIGYPLLFPRYLVLAGLSGTLAEARRELLAAYGLRVRGIPDEFPPALEVAPPQVFARDEDRLHAVLQSVATEHARGRPVLIGTDSVKESERLSAVLRAHGLPHQTLNARQDRDEAEHVARAGQAGRITVATNMAGRGTDILLGPGVAETGGLHVVCCQHNSSRRIDRQLLGRAARHGQPGSAGILLCLDEGLLARYLPTAARRMLARLSSPGRPMPLVIAKPLTRLTQALEDRRLRRIRALQRRQDAQQRQRLLFGPPAE